MEIRMLRGFILVVLLFNYTVSSLAQLSPKKSNGKWGFVNKSGEWIVKPKYDEVSEFHEDLAAVSKKGKWGFIFESGKWAIKPIYAKVTNFSEGLAGVLPLKSENGLYSFIDRQGVTKIAASFKSVSQFKNGECNVVIPGLLPGQYMVINSEGKQISPPLIKREKLDESAYHIVSEKSDGQKIYTYYDGEGKQLAPWSQLDYVLGETMQKIKVPAKVENDQEPDDFLSSNSGLSLYAYISASGEIISDWYEEIRAFSEMKIAVSKKNHRYGFINSSYEVVTPFQYLEVRKLDDRFYVGQESEEGFVLINSQGQQIGTSCHGYDLFDEDYILGYAATDYYGDRKYRKALFDDKGNQKSGWYAEIYPKSSYYYRVVDGDYGWDAEGNMSFENRYNYMIDSTCEIIGGWRKSHQIRYALESGKYRDSIYQMMHQPNTDFYLERTFFEDVYYLDLDIDDKGTMDFNGGDFYDGMALVSKIVNEQVIDSFGTEQVKFYQPKVKYGFIDWDGDLRVTYKYDYIAGMSNGKAVFKQNGKFGAINYKGKVIIKPTFDLLGNFGNGMAPFYNDSVWGYIYSSGKVALKAVYDEAKPFRFGYAAVKQGKKWGVIDVRGNEVLKFKYRKPPVAIGPNKIEVLIDGVGYEVIDI